MNVLTFGARALLLRLASLLAMCLCVAPAVADEPCRTRNADSQVYSVCEFDLHGYALKLFWKNEAGEAYGGVAALVAALASRRPAPIFAMNAGMYAPDLSPVGLYIENGQALRPVNTANGPGNFHLKPNGIFFVRGKEAGVLETGEFLRQHILPDFATQSGPMLVMRGLLHPKFSSASESRKIRNGVGVRGGHVVVFAISSQPVTFTEFADFFRHDLGCPNALFLDGSISSLYAPSLGRADQLWPAGPIVAAFPRE